MSEPLRERVRTLVEAVIMGHCDGTWLGLSSTSNITEDTDPVALVDELTNALLTTPTNDLKKGLKEVDEHLNREKEALEAQNDQLRIIREEDPEQAAAMGKAIYRASKIAIRRTIEMFEASGRSQHSGRGLTLQGVIDHCEQNGIAYRLTAYPKQGYMVEKIPGLDEVQS